MTRGDRRDHLILELLYRNGEMSFTELEKEEIMAKSTLNDHLNGLLKKKAVRKIIGKTSQHLNHPVYVITAKGRKSYRESLGPTMGTGRLEDYM